MKKKFLEIGKIVTTHGVMGEVKVYPWCDTPDFLTGFSTLYFHKGKDPVAVQQARVHKNMVLLKLQGTDTLEAAQALRNQILYADRADMPLEEGEYFIPVSYTHLTERRQPDELVSDGLFLRSQSCPRL